MKTVNRSELTTDQLVRVVKLRDAEIRVLTQLVRQLGGTDQLIADSIAGLSGQLSDTLTQEERRG